MLMFTVLQSEFFCRSLEKLQTTKVGKIYTQKTLIIKAFQEKQIQILFVDVSKDEFCNIMMISHYVTGRKQD